MASPLRRDMSSTRARPVRPLPSAKGWIVSNWACTTAAWTSGQRAGPTEVAISASPRIDNRDDLAVRAG